MLVVSVRQSSCIAICIVTPLQEASSSLPSSECPQHPQSAVDEDEPAAAVDYTAIPKLLESMLEQVDNEGSVRPTIITPAPQWMLARQSSILAQAETTTLQDEEHRVEKQRAFALLDALTKSGGLQISCADFHVVIAATHCFESSVMDAIVCHNVNPIDKIERSNMITATSVHLRSALDLVKAEELERLFAFSPELQLLER